MAEVLVIFINGRKWLMNEAEVIERRYFVRVKWPIVALIFGMHFFAVVGFLLPSYEGVWLAIVLWYITGFGVTVGYHRYFTHRSFTTTDKRVDKVLAVLGALSGEGDVFSWVARHRDHHAHSDTIDDPHSPLFGGFWFGAMYSHVGWIADDMDAKLKGVGKALTEDLFLKFVRKTYARWHWGLIVILAVCGFLFGYFIRVDTFLWWRWERVVLSPMWSAAYYAASFVGYGYFVRIVTVLNSTWAVNSLSHMYGSQPYKTEAGDNSRDNVIVAIVAHGEGWHNAHHADPDSYRHGQAWWKFDLSACVIEFLAWRGLVENLQPFQPTVQKIAKVAPKEQRKKNQLEIVDQD